MRTADEDLEAFGSFAGKLADVARGMAAKHFRQEFTVRRKADGTVVTNADEAAERAIRSGIEARYPAHGIIGEEYGVRPSSGPFTWVIDPIDGTKAFIAGRPTFGILIALCRDGVPVVGVMDQPFTGERWVGVDGVGTTYNGRPIRVRPIDRIEEAILGCGNPMRTRDRLGRFYDDLDRRALVSLYGGDCYLYGLMACGHVHTIVDTGLGPVDFCALVPIVRNAGGVVTAADGVALTATSKEGGVLACASVGLHAELVKSASTALTRS